MMTNSKRLRIAMAGMRFGSAFVPIYLNHPDVEHVGIIDPDKETLDKVADKFDISRKHADLDEVLQSDDYDAVHLVTPIPLHAEQTIKVLNSGKHCACTVPMATSLEDLHRIVAAQRQSGKNYMMMETAVYTRQFFYAKALVDDEKFGRIQFLRGAHYQDMEGWPDYWAGLPPMWYATHAISPCLALASARAVGVHCFGSGTMPEELHTQYDNRYPVETAIFQLDTPHLAMEVSRSLFNTARGYTESFHVYGERMAFEWPQIEAEDDPVVFVMADAGGKPEADHRGLGTTTERVVAHDRQDLLPPEIARFTVRGKYDDTNPQKSFKTGGGHHGSHPHLAHEFIRSIVEGRKPWVDEIKAADWTAAGLCAHESAMQGGQRVSIPAFDLK
ncbi:MAG: Gfo/Idh/MocA family oxidoreductase [Chloroflexota bacterium]